MAKMDERVDMIGSSILAQAEHESRELTAKANAVRESEIKAFEEKIIRDMFTEVQKHTSRLRADTIKAVSTAQVTAHRSLLRRREELAGMVFASVRARLFEYAKTPAYAETLKAELESLRDSYDHIDSTVYLREADMPMAGEIEAILPGCTVEVDSSIRAGGWKLLNKRAGILIDETLDARITAQKDWFLLNSGMQIVVGK